MTSPRMISPIIATILMDACGSEEHGVNIEWRKEGGGGGGGWLTKPEFSLPKRSCTNEVDDNYNNEKDCDPYSALACMNEYVCINVNNVI